MKNQTTRRAFKGRMASKQDVVRAIPALMGDGAGVIEVPGQPGYVYIRVGDGDLGQAFNNRCPLRDNLAIYVGYDPVTDPDRRIFQVLSVRMADYANGGNTPVPNVAAHHATHEYGGGDDVYVDWRRLMGLRVGRPTGFQVTVDEGVILRAGAWLEVAAQNLNLAALQPVGLLSCYVLIALDSTGTATATAGADVVGALDISDCPIPGAGEIPLAAVRLYGTQTAIGDIPTAPDIVDLRFPQASMTGVVHLEDLDGYARGRIIRGGAADWEAYSLAGAAGSFLRRDANDVLWSTLTMPNAATLGDILYASGANAIGNLADVAVGQALVSGGVGAAPAWSATPTLTGLTLSGLTASTVIYSNAAKAITSLANGAGVLTNDGAGGLSWGAAGGAHDILSATHTDSVANAVTRGSLIYGNSTPAWDELGLGGAAGSFLTRDANDALWSTLTLPNAATTGDILYASGANAIGNLADVAVGSYLRAGGVGVAPLWSTVTLPNVATQGDMWYASAANTIVALAGAGFGTQPLCYSTALSIPFWAGFSFLGTVGGTTNFVVSNTKTLTLTCTDNFNLTIPATGTAALGTGAATRVAYWSDTNTLASDSGFTYAATGATGLGIIRAITDPGATSYNVNNVLIVTLTANNAQTTGGFTNDLRVGGAFTYSGAGFGSNSIARANSGVTVTGSLYGNRAIVIVDATSSVATAYTFGASSPAITAGGAITTLYGFYAFNQGAAGVTNAYGVYIAAQSGAATLNYALYSAGTAAPVYVGAEVRVDGDVGGLASCNTLTGTSDVSANSTGVGTIKFKGATNRDSTGFIKVYIGTTAYYVPVFAAITG